ncbi:MAG: DUF4105 domain-containing protein [Deltaproteobacteria bacterium]|nr:DUF4105 domain-containing protein [Deltaproteobacteria bacterium]
MAITPDFFVQEAQRLKLHEDSQWLSLGHYERTAACGWKSLVDDPAFFLSPEGKHNPKLELAETIKALLSGDNSENSAQCKFPARYKFLKERLKIVAVADVYCPRFQEWFQTINPSGITLIFPTTFINNPASSFGHTLIRIDQSGASDSTRLLSYAANYAASVEADDMLTYAVKGIFGGYKGYFSIEPYYERIKQYADYEHRDIWEYKLNYTQAETELLVTHLWEIKDRFLDYYYFDDNCSYLLLSLLEVGRPRLQLKEQSRPWILPIDTIKTIVAQKDLVETISYRSSPATELEFKTKDMGAEMRSLIKILAISDRSEDVLAEASLNSAEQAQVLELAYDYLVYQNEGIVEEDAAQARALKLLAKRSQIDAVISYPPLERPAIRPEEGHDTVLLTLYGKNVDDDYGGGLRIRPAYHELIDPDRGYVHGSQLVFFDLALSYDELEQVMMDYFHVLKIASLSPRSYFIRPLSYKIETGIEQRLLDKNNNSYNTFLNLGAGLTYKLAPEALVYALAIANNSLFTEVDDHYALSFGVEVGANYYITDKLALISAVSAQSYVTAASGFALTAVEDLRYTLTNQSALRLGYKYTNDPYYDWQEFSVGYDFFF